MTRLALLAALVLASSAAVRAEDPPKTGGKKGKKPEPELAYPPVLTGGAACVTETSDAFLKPPGRLADGVTVATAAPTIDLAYFPGQDYPGKPWSAWGDSLVAKGKYYASIGDHLWPAGNAFVFEYDPGTRAFRRLVDVKQLLGLPEGHYTPGKIHGRLDLGSDGWLYFSTHRGSAKATTDAFHYQGDWIARVEPSTGKAEVVVQGPVPKHCIPNSVLDPERLIFYGGTAPGSGGEEGGVQFFAWDVANRRLLYSGPDGPARYMLLARSTGRLYYTPGNAEGPLMCFDPAQGGAPRRLEVSLGHRSATQETADGKVYTVSQAQKQGEPTLWSFDTRTEQVERLGSAAVGTETYVTSLDVDPTGRFLYYVPGAHGSADRDGSPVVQFDLRTRTKKVIAFLDPFFRERYGCALKGTFSSAIDAKGETLYVTWNASRAAGKAWDVVALTAIHIPASER